MTVTHVVVDGSNLATEGRTLPSLQQLDEAVRAFIDEYQPKTVTVVVDASFPNRIDESERAQFEEAVDAGEVISPPAGVIGRGDAFVLQIADRAGAVVLSNDSFQEFHGQYDWLFDEGRLIGGKPVPHVGWVFMDRSPVRGPLSRRSISEAKKAAKASAKRAAKATGPEPRGPKAEAPGEGGGTRGSRRRGRGGAKADSGKGAGGKQGGGEAGSGKGGAKGASSGDQPKPKPAKKASASAAPRTRGGGGGSGPQPYNDALPFIEFVAAHPLGSIVEGEVERFASHGAYVVVEGARCYLPLKHLADPPPRSAREVLSTGERYQFVVQAIDTPRRGVDLAIPGVVPAPTAPPVEAEAASDPVPDQPEEERVAPAKKARGKKAPAKKKAAAKKAPAKRSAAKKSAAKKTTTKRAPAKKTAAKKKSTAKKASAKKTTKRATAKKAPAKKKATAKKSTAKKASAKKTAKRSTAKKATKKR